MRDPLGRFPIKYKLPFTFLFLCLMILAVGGILVSRFAKDSLEKEIGMRLEAVAVARASAIQAARDLLGRRVQDFASDGLIRDHLRRITEENERDRIAPLAEHLRVNKTPLVSSFLDCAVWDLNGDLVASSRPVPSPAMARVAKRASRIEGLWYSEFEPRNEVDHSPVFCITTPVWDLEGRRVIGRLGAWVHAGRFLAAVPGISQKLLGDEEGTRLVLQDQDRTDLEVPRWLMTAGPKNQELIDQAFGIHIRKAQDQLQRNRPKPRHLYSRIQPFGDDDWETRVELDAFAAMEPIRNLKNRYLGTGLVIMVLALGTVLTTAGFIVLPLNRLRAAAEEIARGNLKARVHVGSDDEIGVVSAAFNAMAEAVDSRTQDLERKRDELALVVQSMRDGLCLLGPGREVILANAAAEPIHDILANRELETPNGACGRMDKDCAHCLVDQRRGDHTCELVVKGRTYEIHATDLPAQSGIGGRLLVSRDITERLKMAEQQSFHERMSVVGEVSSAVAHEINNPLASISMYNQMMADELDEDSPFAEHVEVIGRNAAACKRAIRDLLDNVRGSDSFIDEFDLADVVRDVERFLMPLAKSSRIKLRVALEEDTCWVESDEHQLRQVLVNLVMNAIQASTGHGSEVQLVLKRAGADVICDVIDDGPGIAAEHRERIFDPFFSTKAPGEGTGLGLPTSRRNVEALGGRLELLATSDSGTTFRVTMPARSRSKETFHEQGQSQSGRS